jgi:hypothetical protein
MRKHSDTSALLEEAEERTIVYRCAVSKECDDTKHKVAMAGAGAGEAQLA